MQKPMKAWSKMGNIAFLVPYAPMIPLIKEVLFSYKQDIRVEHYKFNDHTNKVTSLVEHGCEIIISRSGLADRIKGYGLNVTVVELPVTGFDIIRAVQAAKNLGNHIAVVAYPSMARGMECLLPSLGFSFKQYWVKSYDDTEVDNMMFQAVQDGADVIVGGGIICQAAQKYGLPSVFIESGKEAIMLAIEEATRLSEAVAVEKVKNSLFAAVLDNVSDGIITVNSQKLITSINLKAQQILKTSSAKAIGQYIGKIWNEINLSKIIESGQEETNTILQINGIKIVCSKIPIIVSNEFNGALVTFQEINKIQQTEAKIRKEIYNKGHVAKMSFSDIWGNSSTIKKTITLAKEFARTNSNVLIIGETGTGKEVFAQSIHSYSSRSKGPFVAINCAALPSQILESELFGYVAGAFTGASKEGKPGLFELAHGGTIFLDEIAEMDYINQSRLLRVLQERTVMRLGSDRIINIDVRIIAATNKDLSKLVHDNKFRDDLFYRLNVLKLDLPPLRKRHQDIRIIAENFLEKCKSKKLTFNSSAIKALENYYWPGNIRELQNTIERLVALCSKDIVRPADISAILEKSDKYSDKNIYHKEEIEKINAALIEAKGVQTTAAKLLGIDRKTLWRKIRKFGISV